MPDTFAALVLYTFLLFPGYLAYVQRRRYLPQRQQSSLLETVNLVAVSTFTNGLTVGLFTVVRLVLAKHSPDVSRLIREGRSYADPRLPYLFSWGAGCFAFSCLLAIALSRPKVRRVLGTFFNPPIVDVSTWYHVFEHPPDNAPGRRVYAYVECFTTDGSYAAGRLAWYSTEVNETPDRELALVAPPSPPESNESFESPPGSVDKGVVAGNSTLILSAREIQRMLVTWVDEPT
jgi:hypothetical protein